MSKVEIKDNSEKLDPKQAEQNKLRAIEDNVKSTESQSLIREYKIQREIKIHNTQMIIKESPDFVELDTHQSHNEISGSIWRTIEKQSDLDKKDII